MHDDYSWVTQQLIAFLGAITAGQTRDEVAARAAQYAAEAVEAEIGAVVVDGEVVSSVGFRRLEDAIAPIQTLLDGAEQLTSPFKVENILTMPMAEIPNSTLVVGRCGNEAFTFEEKTLVRGMARTLALTIRSVENLSRERTLREESERKTHENHRLVMSLRERQDLLVAVAGIQRSITRRAPLQEVLDEIGETAQRLMDSSVAYLVLTSDGDFANGSVARRYPKTAAHSESLDNPEGIVVKAMSTNRITVDERFVFSANRHDGTAIAVPISQAGQPFGALVVAYEAAGRTFSLHETELLHSLSELASIVLNDAKTLEDVDRASHDPLTRLPNRALFLSRVELAMATSDDVGILFIDLDGFKRVNDTLGHAAGDKLLEAVADRLRECTRDADVIGRIGGDEFAVLMSQRGNNGEETVPETLAARILHELSQPFTIFEHENYIGASIGFASSGSDVKLAEALVRNADLAMYAAKRSGKNQTVAFHSSMLDQLVNELSLEADLRLAIERDELSLVYQPVLKLETMRLAGFEALLRWNHPTRGRVNPLDFIPIAEEKKLMTSIDRWVFRTACEQLVSWKHQYGVDLTMSINVSGQGVLDASFVESVGSTISKLGVNPKAIIVELTEATLITDVDAVEERLIRLKELGVQLAIDDFGTGYSSLTHLHRFPFDLIKIDRSFVSGLADDERKFNMVRGVIQLGQALGLEIVAEGIEERNELSRLAELSSEFGQGYYIARPLEKVDAEAMLSQKHEATTSPLQHLLESVTTKQ